MKYITIISYFVFTIGCVKSQYPEEIISLNLVEEFNEAKWELYLKYLDCIENNKVEDLLKFDLNYYGVDTLDNYLIILFLSPELDSLSKSSNCKYYNGIGFENDETAYLNIDHSILIDYKSIEHNKVRYQKCLDKIGENVNILNPWLKEYYQEKKSPRYR